MFVVLLILFGSFLIGLTIENIGDIGNIIMNIIGFSCILIAVLIGRRKESENHLKRTSALIQ